MANLRVCFMVMPFRRRKVDEPKGADAPAELDCDALWDRAFRPGIEQLGYVPIRADYDPGSVIIKDMLERLALADLVLADVSLANGTCTTRSDCATRPRKRTASSSLRSGPSNCSTSSSSAHPLPAEGRQRTGRRG